MSIPDETLARWAAWPRPGTPGPWMFNSYSTVFSRPRTLELQAWEDAHPLETTSDEDYDDAPETEVASVPVVSGDTSTAAGAVDAAFIAHAPEMREAIDVLVAEVRRLNGPRCARCGDLLGDETITSDYDEAFVHFRCGPDALRGDA